MKRAAETQTLDELSNSVMMDGECGVNGSRIQKTSKTLPVDSLAHSPFNPRQTRPQEDVEMLADRMRQNGFEPTRALWVHENEGKYHVFAGGTRLEAAKKASIEEIPCIIHEGISEEEICQLSDIDNENDEYHRPVPIVDEWISYKKRSEEFNWTQEKIAKAKRCDRSMVAKRLQLATLPNSVLESFVKNDSLKESHGLEIVKMFNLNTLDTWFTAEDAMLEILKKMPEKPTAEYFKKEVDKYRQLVNSAMDILNTLEEPYGSKLVEELRTSRARSISEIKDAQRAIQREFTEEKRKAEEEARQHMQKAEREKAEAEEQERELMAREEWFGKYVRLIHRNIQNINSEDIPDESVDLIFTDPPYDRESIHLYESLAELGARVLKPGGSLIAYAGNYAIPEILPMMQKYLNFWWINAVIHTAGNKGLTAKSVNVGWKPLLWFTKGQRRTKTMIRDTITSGDPGKELHEWQQSSKESDYYIKYLTEEGDVVMDPFLGSGTTILSAVSQYRVGVGIDIERECLSITKERLDEYYASQRRS